MEKSAFEVAVDYLSRGARSVQEVKDKLYKKGFHRDEVDSALEKLKGYRYIDDEEYAKTFVSYYGKKLGKKQILYKLTSEKCVDKVLAQKIVEEKISDEDELSKCLEEAEKYIKKKKLQKKDKNKVCSHLYQKGYDFDIINKAVSTLDFDAESTESF